MTDESTGRRCADEARRMTSQSYAPYSGVRVGAAALTDEGRVVTGCNVENASIGLSICAETNLAGHLVASGGGRLVALVAVAGDGEAARPVRSVSPDPLRVRRARPAHRPAGRTVSLGDLLPEAFGPDDVANRAG